MFASKYHKWTAALLLTLCLLLPAGRSGAATTIQVAPACTIGAGALQLYQCSTTSTAVATVKQTPTLIGIGSTAPLVTLDLSQNNDAVALPAGTSAQRPTGANGMIRYNQSTIGVEAYYNSMWNPLGGSASTITLGTSASSTSPQRGGDATTGLFSASTGTVSVSAAGTDQADFASTGLNLPLATESYTINGAQAVALPDGDTSSIAVGPGALGGQSATGRDNTSHRV